MCCVQAKCMLNSKVHKKFINEFVFITHFKSSQIYEQLSQHGNTGPAVAGPAGPVPTPCVINQINMVKGRGPNTEPCGTPLVTMLQLDWILLSTTHCCLPTRKFLSHINDLSLIS